MKGFSKFSLWIKLENLLPHKEYLKNVTHFNSQNIAWTGKDPYNFVYMVCFLVLAELENRGGPKIWETETDSKLP